MPVKTIFKKLFSKDRKTDFRKLFFDRQGHSWREILEFIYSELRREFYFKFRKKYILKMVKKRKGKCNQCTCCMQWYWKRPCEYLNGKNCTIHDQPDKEPRPRCHLYPFDKKDINPFFKDKCGFYWD